MKIAPLQKQELNFLEDVLSDLGEAAGRNSREGFETLTQELNEWAARVAVIGQVKAGKSTFLNAFLHLHDFLPSDVNPWTSVVTNIRINLPEDPRTGAKFEFFSEADWDEIINGATRMRQLTEQMLPGFDTDLLRRQTEEMRARAQSRLGQHYHALLGTTHDYDFLSADLLQRYVCAGPGGDGEMLDALGRYASITKVANVYMRRPEFQVPVILTDTPGVNDPFLVRDEFTCRSLDQSDVFIVVLSAHQALTSVDVALIRLLAEQETKDVVIFINRIDELDDYSVEVPRVVRDVSDRLSAAIPDIEFTIHAGSAFMADMATRDSDEAREIRDALDNEQLHEYLQQMLGHVPEDQVDRLMAGSGLDDIKRTLSTVIDNGVGCQKLTQIFEETRSEISAVQFATRRERDSVQMQVEKISSQDAGQAVTDLEAELTTVTNIRAELDEHLEAANTQIEKLVGKSWTSLEKSLNGVVSNFIDDQADALRARVTRDAINGRGKGSVSMDLSPLFTALDDEVGKSHAKARAGTDVALTNCLSSCSQAIRDIFPDLGDAITMAGLPYDDFATTLTMSKKSLNVDLVNERSWAFWKKSNVDLEKSLEGMRAVTSAELRPAMEKLLAAFNEAQAERAQAGTDRIRVMLRMTDSAIKERSQRLRRDKRQMQQMGQDTRSVDQVANRLQSQLEVLERRMQALAVLEAKVSRAATAKAA